MKCCTQRDIARELGISQQAVAAVLGRGNPTAQVSDELRKRIVETAEKMQYRIHRSAQFLRQQKSGIIGVLLGGGFDVNPFDRDLPVIREIHKAGYQALVQDVSWYTKGKESEVFRSFLEARVEGIVLLSSDWSKCMGIFEECIGQGIPMVSLGGRRHPSIPQVRSGVAEAMRSLTEYMLQKGVRRLILVVRRVPQWNDRDYNWRSLERVEGFCQAMKEHRVEVIEMGKGLSVNSQGRGVGEKWGKILYLGDDSDPDYFLMGKHAVAEMVRSGERPDGVLFSNDSMLQGALSEFRNLGWQIPEQVRIAGFGDHSWSAHGWIPLTTVKQPFQKMAELSVGLLIQHLKGTVGSKQNLTLRVPCELTLRMSS